LHLKEGLEAMKRKHDSEEQIAFALEASVKVRTFDFGLCLRAG